MKIFQKSKFPANYRYNHVNYSYTSSNSKLSKKHWDLYSKEIIKKYKIQKKKILEIGSNDGYLLKNFQKNNFILGIDSSDKMVKVSKKNKIPCLNETFNNKLSKKIKNKYGYFDFILANHVLNHADDDFNFLGCVNLLKKNSILIIEVPYWAYQVKNSLFDQIYHEQEVILQFLILTFCKKIESQNC